MSLDNEKSESAFIQAILYEAVSYSNGELAVAFEKSLGDETATDIYKGRADYTLPSLDAVTVFLVM